MSLVYQDMDKELKGIYLHYSILLQIILLHSITTNGDACLERAKVQNTKFTSFRMETNKVIKEVMISGQPPKIKILL